NPGEERLAGPQATDQVRPDLVFDGAAPVARLLEAAEGSGASDGGRHGGQGLGLRAWGSGVGGWSITIVTPSGVRTRRGRIGVTGRSRNASSASVTVAKGTSDSTVETVGKTIGSRPARNRSSASAGESQIASVISRSSMQTSHPSGRRARKKRVS